MSEKLQKVLARAGFGSRREIERWITAGRVSVDGRKAGLGDRVGTEQKIRVDGHLVSKIRLGTGTRLSARPRILLYHKPEGEMCTRSDPAGRPTVFDRLPRLRNARWVCIGRLDINTSGLLLFTTDGELANRLAHPRSGIEREYAVRVLGAVGPDKVRRLLAGVRLDDGPARFETVREAGGEGANRWYHVTLREGRRREVRRMWEAVGAKVSRLVRVRYGPVQLPRTLRTGRWQELETRAVTSLLETVGLAPASSAKTGRGKKSVGARTARKPSPQRRTGRRAGKP